MREIEQIADFSKGVITSVDAIDIPAEACVLATNIEPNEGYIVPVKEPSTHTSTANRGLAIKDYGFVVKDSTTKSIICQDNTKIKYSTYSPTSPFDSDLNDLGTYTSTDIITYNREARIAGGSTTQKIFKHTDFHFFGMKDFTQSVTEWNNNITFGGGISQCNELILFRGTPSSEMTVYIPLFRPSSKTTNTVVVTPENQDEEAIWDTIITYGGGKTLAIYAFDIDGVSESKTISSIVKATGPLRYTVTTTTNFSVVGTVKCFFIYQGTLSNYNDNPILLTKIGSTYTCYNCPANSSAYTSIGNGVSVKFGLNYISSGNVEATRLLNAIVILTPFPYIYEDFAINTLTSSLIDIETTPSGTSGYFKTGTDYTWKFSLTYDGGQESSLCSIDQSDSENGSYEKITVNVKFLNIYSISRRVTGINLYRKETKDGVSSLYRLVTSADLTMKDTGVPISWIDKTNAYIKFTYEDKGNWAASYESITGIPEDTATLTPKYTYGIIAYNRLFTVGNEITDEPEISKTLLMSEPFKFDVFNWDENQIMLPSTPKGLGYFRDKIYVFGDNVIWKCNPDMLAIEDTYYGYQLLHNRSMLTTDFGLIFAATTGVYVLDGTNVTELSYPIRDTNGVNSGIRSSCKSWDYLTINNRVFIYYMHSKNQILFFDSYTETGWVYHIRYKSWWYLDFGASSTLVNSCLITDELSNIFWSTGTAIKKMFVGTNYAGATWISKLFTNSTSSQKKRLYFIKHESENYSSNLTAYVDNASFTTLTSDSAGNVTDTTYKSLQLKWANVASSTKRTIKDIEMVFRRMKGVR